MLKRYENKPGTIICNLLSDCGSIRADVRGTAAGCVDPGGPGKPPSDAIVLFNGRDNVRAADPMLQIDVVPGWKEKSAAS